MILILPLYHDTISWAATALLEELHEHPFSFHNMPAIVHSRYPEAIQRSVAVGICRNFAENQGANWLGALSMGLTSIIAGKPLEQAGGMLRTLRRSLEEAKTKYLERGSVIPRDVI